MALLPDFRPTIFACVSFWRRGCCGLFSSLHQNLRGGRARSELCYERSHVSEAHDRKVIDRGRTMSDDGYRLEFLSSVSYYLVPRLGPVPLRLHSLIFLKATGEWVCHGVQEVPEVLHF